ncbi:MAG: Fe-S cluster assembly protein SufD [Legionella sp.]|nr:Fe-S cluster assembly protein SufD [Legionella sp.]
MTEILEFYQKQARAATSSVPWLAHMQHEAITQLGKRGFPTRQDEDWKYTPVEGLLKQLFVQQNTGELTPSTQDLTLDIKPQLLLHNGSIEGLEALQKQLPSEVMILPLADALMNQPDLVKPYLGQILQQEHGFQFLNTALIHYGVLIVIPAGVCIEKPIVLRHIQDRPEAIHLRHLIIAERGSQASIIEVYKGSEDCSYLTNTITEIDVKEHANVTHYKIQQESMLAYHIGHLSVKQSAHSQFASHSFSLGGKLVRSDISIHLQESFAGCLMNGIYAPTHGQHVDHHTCVFHNAPNCNSVQDYKGILTGHSRAVFNGKVLVAKDAQHTDAKQQNKNILLSAESEVDTKPQLEIFADDVMCTHGATVGQLDEEALFYLRTRGLSLLEAKHYLIKAFLTENCRLIPDGALFDWITTLLAQHMEAA